MRDDGTPRTAARSLHGAAFLLVLASVLCWEAARGFQPLGHLSWPTRHGLRVGHAARDVDRVLERHGVLAAAIRPRYQELLYLAFRKVNRRLTLGEEGWLFLAGTTRPMPDWELEARVSGAVPWIRDTVRWFESRGTWVFVVLVPNKATMHPEKLPPSRRPAPPAYVAFVRRLRAQGVRVVDLRAPLASTHGDSWLPTESHWTSQGARRVALRCAAEVRAAWPGRQLPGAAVRGTVASLPSRIVRGDLLRMLGFRPWSAAELPLFVRIEPLVGVETDTGRPLEGGRQEIVLAGTSFSNSRRLGSLLAVALERRVEERTTAGLGTVAAIPPLGDEIRYGVRPPPAILLWEFPERHALDEALTVRLAAFLGREASVVPFAPGVDIGAD